MAEPNMGTGKLVKVGNEYFAVDMIAAWDARTGRDLLADSKKAERANDFNAAISWSLAAFVIGSAIAVFWPTLVGSVLIALLVIASTVIALVAALVLKMRWVVRNKECLQNLDRFAATYWRLAPVLGFETEPGCKLGRSARELIAERFLASLRTFVEDLEKRGLAGSEAHKLGVERHDGVLRDLHRFSLAPSAERPAA